MMTVDGSNRYGLGGDGNGNPLDVAEPLHTVTAHDREALASVHIQKYFGGIVGAEMTEPLPTVTAVDHNALCSAHMVKFKGQEVGTSPAEPLPTVCAKSGAGGFARCYAVLVKADGRNLGHWPKIRDLLNAHCGYQLADDDLILLLIGGVWYFIADITLRMLMPRELYNAMGFPADYIIDRDWRGNEYKKSDQVARCGNAVCPPLAEAMVRANLPEWCGKKIETMAQLENAVAV
jgi:DNA (cytosine-5)-methyltransferase 1